MPAPDLSDRSLDSLISLDGRAALVTGAVDGIGYAVARRLAEAGAAVAVTSRDQGRAAEAAGKLTADGARVVGLVLDLTDRAGTAAAVRQAAEALGGLDILVNNAGIYPLAPALDTTDALWDEVLGTDLAGTFAASREAGAIMAAAGRGVIVNVCSLNSFKPVIPGQAAYTAAKHGLAGLTKALAGELGRSGVRVLGIAPGGVDTPGMRAMLPQLEAAGLGAVVEQVAAFTPLGRIGVPDDVARVVLFAVSDLAAFVTGSILLVDGGLMVL